MTTDNKKQRNNSTQILTVEKIYSPTNRTVTALIRQTGQGMFDYHRLQHQNGIIAAAERSESPSSDCNDGHDDVHRDRPASKL